MAVAISSGAQAVAEERTAAALRESVHHRYPVALAGGGETLLVANRRSGSLSIIDVTMSMVVGEAQIAVELSDFAMLPDGRHALATDNARHELLLIEYNAPGDVQVVGRLSVGTHPVRIAVAADGRRCCVASLWARRVAIVDLEAEKSSDPRLKMMQETPLPFAPREQLLLPGDDKLLVADAFGGQLAVVELETGTVESVRKIPGQNIRDLALSSDGNQVHVAQSISDPLGRTDLADITWGIVAASSIQTLAVDAILNPAADVLAGSRVTRLGDFGNGLADPESAVVLQDGRLLIAAGGIDSVVFAEAHSGADEIVRVGDRPTAVLAHAENSRAYVANTFSDSISVIDTTTREVVAEISLGRQAELSAADRGERLFYDGRLSADSWFSCHSCHTDGHTNGQLADTLGDGTYGDPKLVLSLLGAAETGPWAWNGSMVRLEDQLQKSVQTSMHGQELSKFQLRDLVAFLKTLAPPGPPMSQTAADEAGTERGRALFAELRCHRCHVPPTFTSDGTFDVGLADAMGNRRFNPPSLRGVGQRNRFFHDGRAATLEKAFSSVRHRTPRSLSEQELADLVRYLRSL